MQVVNVIIKRDTVKYKHNSIHSGENNSEKMDLSESMKSLMSKQQSSSSGSRADAVPGVGYVTEKLYMLLQLYLQNKGWNPSSELLQCFAELKDSPLLPNAAYLQ